jgi:glycosyltransferase involved in cell wall biosynthesis
MVSVVDAGDFHGRPRVRIGFGRLAGESPRSEIANGVTSELLRFAVGNRSKVSFVKTVNRPRILTFLRHYLPGYRSGGPIRTVASMVESLSDAFEFLIVTKDRDSGMQTPYENVPIGQWTFVGKARVFYVSKESHNLRTIRRIMVNTRHDMLYLNSVYAHESTLMPLLLRAARLVPRVPVVIAPRGELSDSAINMDWKRKRPYLALTRASRIFRDVIWQASGPGEFEEIRQRMGVPAHLARIAEDIAHQSRRPTRMPHSAREPSPAAFKIVFLSRLSPEKNLIFLLEVLSRVRTPVQLEVIGPWRSERYRQECERKLRALPAWVSVVIHKAIAHEEVHERFAAADLFAFPTLGESFGHVIGESLSAGTPVLVSDRTPWRSHIPAIETLPLVEEIWRSRIEDWARLPREGLVARREAAQAHAVRRLNDVGVQQRNIELIEFALGSGSK